MFRRIPFIVVVSVIVTLAVPVFVIWPSINQIRLFSTAIYKEYEFLEEKSRRGQFIRKAKSEYESLQQRRNDLQSIALSPGSELGFITEIENIADTNLVSETLRLDVEHPQSRTNYKAIPF